MPVLTVFGGPNGSGKSSVVALTDFDGRENLLDPDAIARRINPTSPERAAFPAGREAIERAAKYIERRESFAIETTLAGNWTTSVINAAQEQTFSIRFIFICVDSPERSIQRVRERVARGGHDVPDSDIRRRYARSLSNARRILGIAHQGFVFDNSGSEPRPLFDMQAGGVLNIYGEIPPWAATLLEGAG